MKDIYMNSLKALREMLDNARISYECHELWDGGQIIFNDDDGNYLADVVCHSYSYGNKEGLFEAMGAFVNEDVVGDTVEGNLTVENVYERASKLYRNYDNIIILDRKGDRVVSYDLTDDLLIGEYFLIKDSNIASIVESILDDLGHDYPGNELLLEEWYKWNTDLREWVVCPDEDLPNEEKV